MHWLNKTLLRDILLASKLIRVTDGIVLAPSNYVTKVEEANVPIFD